MPRWTPEEIRKVIRERLRVSAFHMAQARRFLLSSQEPDVLHLAKTFLEANDADFYVIQVPTPDANIEAQLDRAAKTLAFQIAFVESLVALMGEGLVLPLEDSTTDLQSVLFFYFGVHFDNWKAGISFAEFRVAVPARIRVSVLAQGEAFMPLEPLLFRQTLDGLPPEVAEALYQAARCLRHHLYLPAVAMIGQALEHMWGEACRALLSRCLEQGCISTQKAGRIQKKLNGLGIAGRMEEASRLVERLDRSLGGRNLASRLHGVFLWSERVRMARNALHPDNPPPFPLTYESVAGLLLDANRHFSRLMEVMGR